MAGCWRQEGAARTVEEMWMAPGGGTMFGVSRTVAGGRTVAYESMRIHEEGGAQNGKARRADSPMRRASCMR
jgi:hypothetical protein